MHRLSTMRLRNCSQWSSSQLTQHVTRCRDEKVRLLRCVQPLQKEDTVLGQYTAGNGESGYLDDEGVPKDSKTPTFALCVLHIQNDRWERVPFIIKAGKVRLASNLSACDGSAAMPADPS